MPKLAGGLVGAQKGAAKQSARFGQALSSIGYIMILKSYHALGKRYYSHLEGDNRPKGILLPTHDHTDSK